jgi:hypothetical protein
MITRLVFPCIKKYCVSSCTYWKEVHLLVLEVNTSVLVTHCFHMRSSIWCHCEHWLNELASLAQVKIEAVLLITPSVITCVVYNVFIHISWSPCYNALKIEPVIDWSLCSNGGQQCNRWSCPLQNRTAHHGSLWGVKV